MFRKAVFDTNVYVDWLNRGARPELMVGEGFVRHLSAAIVFEEAGAVLRTLRARGMEIRRASIVNDVVIAMSCRAIGATLYTADFDYEAIRSARDFRLVMLR